MWTLHVLPTVDTLTRHPVILLPLSAGALDGGEKDLVGIMCGTELNDLERSPVLL